MDWPPGQSVRIRAIRGNNILARPEGVTSHSIEQRMDAKTEAWLQEHEVEVFLSRGLARIAGLALWNKPGLGIAYSTGLAGDQGGGEPH
jgi:hypothetical protein